MEIPIGTATIRDWRSGDELSLVQYANDRAVWLNLRDRFPHPYTRADARRWLAAAAAQNPATNFAIALNQQVIGGIGFVLQDDVHRRSAEIGYWLGRPFWGQGIATRAVSALTDWAFQNFDLCRVYATVFEWNPASARVLEKAGYTLEGRLRQSANKDGRTIDQFLYAIVR